MMPSTTNVLDEARDLVQKRLADLDEERKRLERPSPSSAAKPGAPRAPRGSRPRMPRRGTPRRRAQTARRGGTRADQAVKLITTASRASAPRMMAKQMKIKPNYLYRVLGDLEKEKRVKKEAASTTPH